MSISPNVWDSEAVKKYQAKEIDDLVNEMRNLTDWSDEQIFDEIVEFTKLSEFERETLAEKLGIS